MHRRERGWGVTKPFVFLTPRLEAAQANAREPKSSSPFCGFKPYTPVCVCVQIYFGSRSARKCPGAFLFFFSNLPFQSASQITETHTHTHTHTLADATTHARRETVSHSCSGAIFLTKKPVALSEPAGRGLCILLCDDILEGNDDQFILSPTHFFFFYNDESTNSRMSHLESVNQQYQIFLPLPDPVTPHILILSRKKNARKGGKSRFSPHITNYQCTKLFFRCRSPSNTPIILRILHTHTRCSLLSQTHLSEIQSRKNKRLYFSSSSSSAIEATSFLQGVGNRQGQIFIKPLSVSVGARQLD